MNEYHYKFKLQLILNHSVITRYPVLLTTTTIYKKSTDRFISGFVTAGRIRMVCLHDVKNDDGIKNFFMEMYETYIKVSFQIIKHFG